MPIVRVPISELIIFLQITSRFYRNIFRNITILIQQSSTAQFRILNDDILDMSVIIFYKFSLSSMCNISVLRFSSGTSLQFCLVNQQRTYFSTWSYNICKIIGKILQHDRSVTILSSRIGSIQTVKIDTRVIDINIHVLTDLQTARIVFI